MKSNDHQLDPQVQADLEKLRAFPPRHPQAAARGRERFLAQARLMAQERQQNHAAIVRSLPRRPAWHVLAAIAIALMLALFIGGSTVYAAQGSLPGELLYPVKTLSEDSRLAFAFAPQRRLALLLDFADRRVGEITALASAGQLIPQVVPERLNQHLDQALIIAASLEDESLLQALEQIRLRLKQQEQLISQAQVLYPADPVLEQARARIQERMQLVNSDDANAFRQQVQQHLRHQSQQGTPTQTVTPRQGYGPSPETTKTPDQGNGPGPDAIKTPGQGYGPGPDATKTPGQGHGSGPEATKTPGQGRSPDPELTKSPSQGHHPSSTIASEPDSGQGKPAHAPGGGGGKP